MYQSNNIVLFSPFSQRVIFLCEDSSLLYHAGCPETYLLYHLYYAIMLSYSWFCFFFLYTFDSLTCSAFSPSLWLSLRWLIKCDYFLILCHKKIVSLFFHLSASLSLVFLASIWEISQPWIVINKIHVCTCLLW